MLYLIANILFASAFMLCIKWAQVRAREDVLTIGAINYIVAAIWVLPEFIGNDVDSWSGSAIWTGALMGSSYFIAFFFVIHAIKYVGASSTTGIAVLSILVPIGCGVYIWGETPNEYQVIGVGLALFSLSLIGGKSKARGESDAATQADQAVASGKHPWLTPFVLVTFFLLAGASRLSQEAFKHVSTADQRPTFLMTAFALAAIPSIVILIVRRRRVLPIEVGFGFLMGASNVLQSHYMLKALEYYDGFIVFPVVSAGSLVLTTWVATWMLDERLSRRTVMGIVTATVALALLNYLPSGA